MDRLAKRAGVAMLIVIATAGSAFALGLARYAGSLDADRGAAKPKLAAALKLPNAPLLAAIATPKPATLPEVVIAPQADLARAFGKALGTTSKKPTLRLKTPDIMPDARSAELVKPRPDDLLDFGPGASDREAKFTERGAKAFSVRQPGGTQQAHKLIKDSEERVTFETDLGRPGNH